RVLFRSNVVFQNGTPAAACYQCRNAPEKSHIFPFSSGADPFTLGLEEAAMQSGPPAEDLHAILSRFHTWAGKDAPNGNGQANGSPNEGIREIPYEEAIRQHRSRQAARSQRRPADPKTKAAPAPQPTARPMDTHAPVL